MRKHSPQSMLWRTAVHLLSGGAVRNHASAILACDFFVTIAARFRTLYVWNVTEHPTAEWTVQQFRAFVPGDQPQRFLIHDRDSIYAATVDGAVEAMGLSVLKTPVRCPQANAFGERLIGTIRRECLDWVIVLHERHLRAVRQTGAGFSH